MQEISHSLDRLQHALEAAPQIASEARRAALSEAGQAIRSAVVGRLGGTGRIARYQEVYVGTGGGYTAVRPVAKTEIQTSRKRKDAAGYVTNSIESGHAIRRPGPNSRRKSRAVMAAVRGKYMYMDTERFDADRIAAEVGRKIVDAVENHLKEASA